MGRSEKESKEVAVIVTCYGATSSDAELLKGGESAALIVISMLTVIIGDDWQG